MPDGSKALHDSLDNVVREVAKLKETSGDGHPADEDILAVVEKERQSYIARLISSASTRQYESATLPARQMGQDVRDAPFSEKEQRQSRYDGGLEEDGLTKRPLVPIVSDELLAHIAREWSSQRHRTEQREVFTPAPKHCIPLRV